MSSPPVDHDAILAQLDRVLRSPAFQRGERSSALLRYVVQRTLAGEGERLKEYTLGAEALGRGPAFDARTDPIVRAEASRLRDRLARYYEADGRDDPIVLSVPKGSYVPRFSVRDAGESPGAAPQPEPSQALEPPPKPSPEPMPIPSVATRSRSGRRRGWLAAGSGLLVGVVAAVAWMRHMPLTAGDPPLLRFEVELRSGGTLGSEVGTDVVLSADGTRLVFVARDSTGRAHLYARHLEEPTAHRLPGTDGARVPFLSPDGQWVGFWADGQVKRVALAGGSPVVLCDATDVLGASWGGRGEIMLALNPTGKLWRLPATGGAPRVLLDLSRESVVPVWPQVLPGGRMVLFTTLPSTGADLATIEVLSLVTGERRVLVRGGTFGRFVADGGPADESPTGGHLVYVNQGTLYAVSFDLERLAVRGASVPVLEDVAYSRIFGYAQFDVARTGTAVFRRTGGTGEVVVAQIDRVGESRLLVARAGRYDFPRPSPDGRLLALSSVESGTSGVLVGDATGEGMRRVSRGTTANGGLLWWADGRRLVVGGRGGLTWFDVSRNDPPTRLAAAERVQLPWSVAPDGRLAWHELAGTTGFDLWTAPVTATATGLTLGTPVPFLRTSAFEVYPAFSPDGRWLAYGSNTSGTYQVYVRRFPDDGTVTRISTVGGWVPVWSPNGRELLYPTVDQRVMIVPWRVEDSVFVAGAPRPWPAPPLADAGVFPAFHVAADGVHLVALLPAARREDRPAPDHATVLLNFSDEVRRRLASF